eukprot:7956_1
MSSLIRRQSHRLRDRGRATQENKEAPLEKAVDTTNMPVLEDISNKCRPVLSNAPAALPRKPLPARACKRERPRALPSPHGSAESGRKRKSDEVFADRVSGVMTRSRSKIVDSMRGDRYMTTGETPRKLRATAGKSDTQTRAVPRLPRRLSVPLCDVADAKDGQCVTEYIPAIMEHYRQLELKRLPSPTYMEKQPEISERMRGILVDWLVEVHEKFRLRHEVLYLTVNYLDRFLSIKQVRRSRLQLVGATAMLLASKYHEIYPPEIRDYVFISDNCFTHVDVVEFERVMLNGLKHTLLIATPLCFLERFIRVAGYGETRDTQSLASSVAPTVTTSRRDRKSPLDAPARKLTVTHHFAHYVLDMALINYKMMHFLPSKLAAAALFLSLRVTQEQTTWPTILKEHTTYSAAQLEACVSQLAHILQKSQSHQRSTRKKYSRAKYEAVSRIEVNFPMGS